MPKKEKRMNVELSFPEYNTEALALALAEKGVSLEEELEQYLAKLYQKKVTAEVRKFLASKYKEYEQTSLEPAKAEPNPNPEQPHLEAQP